MERIGQQLGNYRLLRTLGKGSFAEVYLGEHIHLQSFAAVKVLYAQLTSELQENFLNEARILAHLSHPHIIHILDFGVEQGGVPYLIMEYAPQGSLRQRHPRRSQLPLSLVVEYIKQITDGLQYAHGKKLIHRDLKPDNILLGEQGELLISDFGVALIARTTRSLHTPEDNFAGTAAYMAPEQLRGLPQFASDQYALGIMTYEWLCGMRPFQGTMLELYEQHLSDLPTPLRQHVPHLPPEVEQVVLTALEKDPARRFASVKAFAEALEQAYDSSGQAENGQSGVAPSLSGPTVPLAAASQPGVAAVSLQNELAVEARTPAYNSDPTLTASWDSMPSPVAEVPLLPSSDATTPVINPHLKSGPGEYSGGKDQPRPRTSTNRHRRSRSKVIVLLGLALLLLLLGVGFGVTRYYGSSALAAIPIFSTPTVSSTAPVVHATSTAQATPKASATSQRCRTSSVSSNPVYQGNGYAFSNGGTYRSASSQCKGKVYFAFTSKPPVADTQVRLCIAGGACGNWVKYTAVKKKLLIMQDLPVGTSFHLQFQSHEATDSYQVSGKLYY